jgi:xanthine dehydrogenase accessory factor
MSTHQVIFSNAWTGGGTVIPDFYKALADAVQSRQPSWLTTVVTTTGSTPARLGMKMIVYADGRIRGTIGGGELERLVIEKVTASHPSSEVKWGFDLGGRTCAGFPTSMVCGGVEEILVEPLRGGAPLFVFGGGHCGVALSWLASWVGFDVTVYDNRQEWASAEKHPSAGRTICAPYDAVLSHLAFPPEAYAVIMTHGHAHDSVVLRQLLDQPLKYLGMIGSAKKVRALFEQLRQDGASPEQLARVRAPVGFPIGSHTPEEIAVSIVAQMIGVRNGQECGEPEQEHAE